MQDKKEKTKSIALNFVRGVKSAVVATTSVDGEPYAATVFFVVDDDFSFYFVTKTDTQKCKNMMSNPIVALVFSEADTLKTLQVQGGAEMQLDDRVIGASLARLMAAGENSHPWIPPIERIEAGEYALVRITPTWVRFADFGDEDNADDECFEQIVP